MDGAEFLGWLEYLGLPRAVQAEFGCCVDNGDDLNAVHEFHRVGSHERIDLLVPNHPDQRLPDSRGERKPSSIDRCITTRPPLGGAARERSGGQRTGHPGVVRTGQHGRHPRLGGLVQRCLVHFEL